jgi:hypothetical protein
VYDGSGNLTEDGKLKASFIEADQLEIDYAKINDISVTSADIATAAITGAKIQNGTITNAKIGNAQVDTLQIRANAVTVPASATRTSAFWASTSWTTVGAVSYNHGFGNTIPGTVQLTVAVSGTHLTDSKVAFQLIINGSVVGSYSQRLSANGTVSCTRFLEVNLPAGSFTVYLRCRQVYLTQNPDDEYVHFRSSGFVILGAKR